MTWAGYILGFPTDTPESIARDIEIIKKELPIDILEFFCLTPLPGSEDHKKLYMKGVPMDPDMNKYDLEHVCTGHPRSCRRSNGRQVYRDAWARYYTDEHVETDPAARARVNGINMSKVANALIVFSGATAHRGRASAAVRLRAPQVAHAAPSRHADRQPADLLSVARLRLRSRARSNGAAWSIATGASASASRLTRARPTISTSRCAPVEGANRPDEFVEVYADRIPKTYGAPVREAVAG